MAGQLRSSWARHLIWGNYRVTGGVPLPGSNAWATSVVVGRRAHARRQPRGVGRRQSRQRRVGRRAGNVVWGELTANNVVWGESGADNVVWGEARGDNVVWGEAHADNVVWGEACGGLNCKRRAVGRTGRR